MPKKRATRSAVGNGRRNLALERTWRSHLEEQAASGLSSKEFCQERGLNVNNFQRWRQEISRRDREKPSTSIESANPFVPVRVIALPQSEIGLEVLLPGQAVIQVTDNSPLDLLAKVLRALEVQC